MDQSQFFVNYILIHLPEGLGLELILILGRGGCVVYQKDCDYKVSSNVLIDIIL